MIIRLDLYNFNKGNLRVRAAFRGYFPVFPEYPQFDHRQSLNREGKETRERDGDGCVSARQIDR